MFAKTSYSVFRAVCNVRHCNVRLCATAYKSQYNIDLIYPNNTGTVEKKSTALSAVKDNQEHGDFSGYIPMDDLEVTYSRSSGPGGQNVNKVNTKVEVRFHVPSATWIPDFAKPRLLDSERGRVTKDGKLIVRSDRSRRQMLNQADCLDRIRQMVWAACQRPVEPTEEELALRSKRLQRAKREILREKRMNSQKKQHRGGPGVDCF